MNNTADTKTIKWLGFGHFMGDLFSSFMVPILPFIAARLSLTIASISVMISLSHLTSSIMQPVFGHFADKMKKRFFLIWGIILCSVFIPLAAVMDSAIPLALCLVIGTTGNALFHPQATGLVAVFNHKNPQLTKYMGLFLALGTIGFACGPTVSSTIAKFFGLQYLPYIGIIGVIYAILLYFNVPKIPIESINKDKTPFLDVLKEVCKSKPLLILIYVSMMKSVIMMSYSTLTPFLFKDLGYGMGMIGFLTTSLFVMGGIATVVSPKIETKLGTRNVFRISFLGILPLTIIFLLTYKAFPAASFVAYSLIGFFAFFSVSVNMVMAQKLLPKNCGVASGIIGGFAWGLAGLSLTPLGFLANHFGVGYILLAVSILTFFSTYLINFLPEKNEI